jgi:hypothetical protein
MSGQKGMKYFGAAIIEELLRLREEGKSHHEIARAKLFGLRNTEVSKNQIERHR